MLLVIFLCVKDGLCVKVSNSLLGRVEVFGGSRSLRVFCVM